jgi:hypothetical protein
VTSASNIAERNCGESHRSVSHALDCAERHKMSRAAFGSLTAGTNLWWGEKYTGKLRNLGYVIGLRNVPAEIWWRLDYDEHKGAHVNQGTLIRGTRRWAKIYHPIRFQERHVFYDEEWWVLHWWLRWTMNHTDKVPPKILSEMERRGLSFPRRGGQW